MKILLVHPHDIYCPLEPWTIRIVSLAREFRDLGHTVKLVYFPRVDSPLKAKIATEGIEVIAFDRRGSPAVLMKNISRMYRLARWAQVVHFQKCFYWAAAPALCAAYAAGKPLHYDWDDWEEKIWESSCVRGAHAKLVGFFLKTLEAWLPVLADSVSCASGQLKEMAAKRGVKREFIFDAPVGADLARFHPGQNGEAVRQRYAGKDDLVIYLGQLHGAQYTDLFIRSAGVVLRKKPRTKFLIIGDGSLSGELREMVRAQGLERSISFSGAVAHDEVPGYLAAATVCVASFADTEVTRCKSPLKIAEYLASGKAIVASDVGDVGFMLGGAGIMTIPGNFHDLAKGVLTVLEDSDLRARLEHASRKRAEERYNWRMTALTLLSAYQKIRWL